MTTTTTTPKTTQTLTADKLAYLISQMPGAVIIRSPFTGEIIRTFSASREKGRVVVSGIDYADDNEITTNLPKSRLIEIVDPS